MNPDYTGVFQVNNEVTDCMPLVSCRDLHRTGLHICRLQRVKKRSHSTNPTFHVHLKVSRAFSVFPSNTPLWDLRKCLYRGDTLFEALVFLRPWLPGLALFAVVFRWGCIRPDCSVLKGGLWHGGQHLCGALWCCHGGGCPEP